MARTVAMRHPVPDLTIWAPPPAHHARTRLHATQGSVGIVGGTIAVVSDVPLEAKQVIDCTGLVISPGERVPLRWWVGGCWVLGMGG
jgi:imidazolonepropionase-like amidohydrolase